MRIGRPLANICIWLFLALMVVLAVFPFVWMIVGMTNTTANVVLGKMTPGGALFDNLGKFFAQTDAALAFYNSAKVAGIGSVLTLAISSLAGYGFEIFRSRARDQIYGAILLTIMIPFAVLMIPLFMIMGRIGLINTHIAIILPAIASGFIVFYFRQATKAFPSELRDVARVDGLKEWQIFLYIYVPTMRSTYAAAFIITFMTAWNNYLWPLIVMQSNEMKTITLVISSLASAYYPDYGVVMVGAVLATLPTLVVFFTMQREFVQGMLGAVK